MRVSIDLKKLRLNKVLQAVRIRICFVQKTCGLLPEMIHSLLEAYLSSSEEELFGREFPRKSGYPRIQ